MIPQAASAYIAIAIIVAGSKTELVTSPADLTGLKMPENGIVRMFVIE